MHPTRDTLPVKLTKRAGGRVMPALDGFGYPKLSKEEAVSYALLFILYLMAAAILVPLVWVLGFWLKGADVIALPGVGIIIATPLLVSVLVIAEVGAIFCAAYCVRFLPPVRMLFADDE
jgi:hypothetical protein